MSARITAKRRKGHPELERQLLDSPAFATSVYDIVARLGRQLRAASLPEGITPERLSTLGAIRANEPTSLSDLAAIESLSIGAMSRSVATLEEQGLVKRQQHNGDGRSVLLSSTAKGKRVFTRALQQYVSHLIETMSGLNERQRTAIQKLLAGVSDRSD